MNLICPHCQKMVSVPDQVAGQTTQCTFCGQAFQVPPLPPPVMIDLPADIPLVPEPPAPEPPKPQPTAAPAEEGGVYRVAPEPPRQAPAPPPPSPRREERATATPRPAPPPPPPAPAFKPAPAPPPAGYVHTRTLWLSPQVVPWIAPVSLLLVFVLQFVNWTGAYPGGYGVYTQSAAGSIWGWYDTDPVGEQVMQKQKEIDENKSSNWFKMGLYFLAITVGLVLAVAPQVVRQASLRLPPVVQQFWPWRSAILLGLASLALVVVLWQLTAGFSLENAITTLVEKGFKEEKSAAKTPQDKKQVDIKEGMELGKYNLQRTTWDSLAVLLNVVAILGILSELWLEKRGARPMPRVETQW